MIYFLVQRKLELIVQNVSFTSDEMDIDHGDHKNDSAPMPPLQRHVVKHNTIANRTFTQ